MTERAIHQGQPVASYGAALSGADAAVILLHGRGSSAQSILALAAQLPQGRIAYLAPQAASHTWWPNSGFIPLESNEPYVSSALQAVADLLARLAAAGIPAERILLGGFSQGACLAAEFAARHPRRYGGLFVLSGALLGPPDMPRHYAGSLEGTPVFIAGCERDPWVTERQLRLSGRFLQELGGSVQLAIQPGSEHTIRPAEVVAVRDMIARAASSGA
jgi:predicted esterase